MITNNDLKVLMKVKVILEGYKKHDILEEFTTLIDKLVDNKKQHSARQNEKNKQNKRHRNLIAKINYNKKVGNTSKVKLYEQQLEEFKKGALK